MGKKGGKWGYSEGTQRVEDNYSGNEREELKSKRWFQLVALFMFELIDLD